MSCRPPARESVGKSGASTTYLPNQTPPRIRSRAQRRKSKADQDEIRLIYSFGTPHPMIPNTTTQDYDSKAIHKETSNQELYHGNKNWGKSNGTYQDRTEGPDSMDLDAVWDLDLDVSVGDSGIDVYEDSSDLDDEESDTNYLRTGQLSDFGRWNRKCDHSYTGRDPETITTDTKTQPSSERERRDLDKHSETSDSKSYWTWSYHRENWYHGDTAETAKLWYPLEWQHEARRRVPV